MAVGVGAVAQGANASNFSVHHAGVAGSHSRLTSVKPQFKSYLIDTAFAFHIKRMMYTYPFIFTG